jgi:hypothetical protein
MVDPNLACALINGGDWEKRDMMGVSTWEITNNNERGLKKKTNLKPRVTKSCLGLDLRASRTVRK